MKAVIPPPFHESYQKHRKQRTWQIILPVIAAALLFLTLVVLVILGASSGTGDVARWAATSAIFISIPIIIMSLIFFLILAGMVYLSMRLLRIFPIYTGKAQDFAYKVARTARRVADAVAKPFITLDGLGASINRFLGRK